VDPGPIGLLPEDRSFFEGLVSQLETPEHVTPMIERFIQITNGESAQAA
jgi:hypothetical protein